MAVTSGRLVRKDSLPVLPVGTSDHDLGREANWESLRDSGKFLIAVGENGRWIDIPLDETGLPLYETIMDRPIPKKNQRKKGK